ncbi:phosphoribosylglycinamide formyltransferase [Fundicoccus culcitae]|uniref:Phosphoribosylglycinamide formyltransferase n=1 Tax=Fundicoccus culcitae TaxID=2969821 RepID=A0ABY5P8W2_9LACT|nr:phosphoribosylglycinamide formyltransferase [Fundicoccus culcitae]UUX35026.1 phosphoribosylglycinamide formyltransferase [Fundicoccus culcitae]
MNIALFASGTGSNVQALITAVEEGRLDATLVCLVCDNPQAAVIDKAQQAQIPTLVLPPSACPHRQAWEEHILAFLQAHQTDLIVLAGFMRIIGDTLLEAYPKRIINIHPSLLPEFPGRHGIQDAYEAGVAQTGVTIHFVDAGIDTGEIIAQESLAIPQEATLAELEAAIHAIEHRLYPAALQTLIEKGKMDK